jgi:archaellum component FlaG (FlaF/FlaG flagellin family)
MLRHVKVFIDKETILKKINANENGLKLKPENVYISNATYNENGSVDIMVVVNIGEEEYEEYCSVESLRRQKL